jgi:hypothetical protein
MLDIGRIVALLEKGSSVEYLDSSMLDWAIAMPRHKHLVTAPPTLSRFHNRPPRKLIQIDVQCVNSLPTCFSPGSIDYIAAVVISSSTAGQKHVPNKEPPK